MHPKTFMRSNSVYFLKLNVVLCRYSNSGTKKFEHYYHEVATKSPSTPHYKSLNSKKISMTNQPNTSVSLVQSWHCVFVPLAQGHAVLLLKLVEQALHVPPLVHDLLGGHPVQLVGSADAQSHDGQTLDNSISLFLKNPINTLLSRRLLIQVL